MLGKFYFAIAEGEKCVKIIRELGRWIYSKEGWLLGKEEDGYRGFRVMEW